MKVVRLNQPHPYFSDEKIARGLAFLAIDEPHEYPFSFTILNHDEAIIHVFDETFIAEVIEEFLYYSGHISKVVDQYGATHFIREKVHCFTLPIDTLFVSQFYISEEKLSHAHQWIKTQEDIIVPVMHSKEGFIVADGHTRLKAALDKGFKETYVYVQANDALLYAFFKEAKARKIDAINDMEILSKEAYHEKWHKFCDAFIKAYENHLKEELL